MTKLKIKTLDELLHKDQVSIGDIKRKIEGSGVCFVDAYEEWKAAPKDQPGSEAPIQAALYALREFAQIRREDADPQLIDDYYRKPDSQPICFYGFNHDDEGRLFIDTSQVQEQEELIQRLQDDLNQLTETGATSKADELRAIVVHTWLHTHAPLTRAAFWDKMNEVDPELFRKQTKNKAAERAMDRVNKAYEKRYGERIKYTEGIN